MNIPAVIDMVKDRPPDTLMYVVVILALIAVIKALWLLGRRK